MTQRNAAVAEPAERPVDREEDVVQRVLGVVAVAEPAIQVIGDRLIEPLVHLAEVRRRADEPQLRTRGAVGVHGAVQARSKSQDGPRRFMKRRISLPRPLQPRPFPGHRAVMNPAPLTTLDLVHGELLVRDWPNTLRPPFGLVRTGSELRGHARLRRPVREALQTAGLAFQDHVAPPPLLLDDTPTAPEPTPSMLPCWLANDGRGIACCLPEATRLDFTISALRTRLQPALVVTRDSGAEINWTTTLAGHGLVARPGQRSAATVVTVAEAARTMHWRARRHDLLVVDRPEQMPLPAVLAVLDGSAALLRLGFVDAPDSRRLLRWCSSLGPVLGVVDAALRQQRIELHLPLPPADRIGYDEAWHTFLCVFDVFVAAQPNAGFGTFVQQARGDPKQRPGLFAWHRALQLASWNRNKADAVAELLARHRDERILVFTPDRRSTYELARTHLIAPVTAELPRRERQATLAAFAAGRLRTLAGPRLLDLGVPEGCADVGILVGGGYGRNQHHARCRRIATTGIVYELIALDTVEVGRAHRFGRSIAPATAVGHAGGW